MGEEKKNKVGKPTKYTSEKVEEILEGIAAHKTRQLICEEAEITYTTFKEWLKKYPTFSASVKKADKESKAKRKDYAAQCIFQKMQTHWQAAAWWLERKHPEEFALKQIPTYTEKQSEIDATQQQTSITYVETSICPHCQKRSADTTSE